jgi:hypothetical protein
MMLTSIQTGYSQSVDAAMMVRANEVLLLNSAQAGNYS